MPESAWAAIVYSIKPERLKIAVLFAFIIIGNILAYSTPYFFKLIADYIVTVPRDEFSVAALTVPLLGISSFLFGQEFLFRIAHILEIKSALKIFDRITTNLYHTLLERPTSYFEDKLSGELNRRIEQIGHGILYFVDQFPWYVGWQAVATLATITLLFIAHVYLFATIMVWFVLFVSISCFLLRLQYKTTQHIAKTHAELSGTVIDTLGNIPIVHSFGATKYELTHYRGYMDSVVAAEKKERWIFLFNKLQQGISIALLGTALVFVSIQLFKAGHITVGDFVIVATTLPSFAGVIWNFGDMVLEVIRRFGTLKDAVAALQTTTPTMITGREKLNEHNYSIRFHKISFSYHDTNTHVFKNFSLEVDDGERVGIIGMSGAGKSTLVKLLLRQYECDQGNIFIGTTDTRNVTLESLRESVAFVPQDTSLFQRTLYDNIRYAKPEATEEEILSASKRAHAHEFILQYPRKYATYVGERGVKLSGGQRQRIAIARAILKNAPILVLDEATSALDSASEEIVQQGLHMLFEKRTVIAIAHRLSTLRAMDRIVVIDEGKIVEQGNPQELLTKEEGVFKTMWEHQRNGFLIDELVD